MLVYYFVKRRSSGGSDTAVSEKIEELKKAGYKTTWDGKYELFYPPDTVFFYPGSLVYHYDTGCGAWSCEKELEAVPEAEAVRRGMRRCKKCEWGDMPIPAPCIHEVSNAKPAYRFKYRYRKVKKIK